MSKKKNKRNKTNQKGRILDNQPNGADLLERVANKDTKGEAKPVDRFQDADKTERVDS